jgi:hypothetical protein
VAGLVGWAALACGNCHRLIEPTPHQWPHRAPRRLGWTVRWLTFQEFRHALGFIRFFKWLLGQKSAVYKPQACTGRPLSGASQSAFANRVLLRTGPDKTLLYQVQTMEIRTPLD